MEFDRVVARRRMVRRYRNEPIDRHLIERVVNAGVHAPSAGFSQGQRFVVVTDAKVRSSIARAANEDSFASKGFDPWLSVAPVHIVLCTDPGAYRDRYSEPDKDGSTNWDVPYWWVDVGASLMALLYGAVDVGLSAGFLGAHAFEGLHAIVGVPEDVLIAGVVTLGFGIDDRGSHSVSRGRIAPEEAVRWEHW